jgi:hypothetical protein
MLSAPQTPAAMLEQVLPKKPKQGDIFVLPPGVSGGGTSSLELKHRTERIGFALNWTEVPGREGLIHLNWVTTNFELLEKLVVELVTTHSLFTSLRYSQDSGWQGWDRRAVSETSTYTRLTSYVPSCQVGELMTYERVYAHKINY